MHDVLYEGFLQCLFQGFDRSLTLAFHRGHVVIGTPVNETENKTF